MTEQNLISRKRLVEIADSYIGTPWQHQGRLKGANGGIDCVGLVACIAKESGYDSSDHIHYKRVAENGEIADLLAEKLDRLPDRFDFKPADWILFDSEFTRQPQHIAMIRSGCEGVWQIIHAISGKGVVVNRLDSHASRLIHSAYRVRGIVD
jgi:cell wall-associated NlpC family hydrolase